MKTKIYLDNENYLAGMTIKDALEPENNNMALHACINTEDIITNRKKLAAVLQLELEDFVCANQTHSSNLQKVTLSDKGAGAYSIKTAIANTDALFTYDENLLLCCFTADCVPLLFYNPSAGIIGVIHSGWQGTVKEITLKVFQHLIQVEKCAASDFQVYIGMAISQEKFEVSKDVYIKYKALPYAKDYIYYQQSTGKYHIDNQKTVKKQCQLAGIPSTNIMIDHDCTYKNPHGFSYRENKQCGRHLSFILKKPGGHTDF